MLADDTAGRPNNKADHNHDLLAGAGRSRTSIEYKHQNVSAVLVAMGEVWIAGYKPAFNFQMSLAEAVARRLARNPAWVERAPEPPAAGALLPIVPPPNLSNQPPPEALGLTLAIAARFDAAGRDARNRALGRAGEERVLHHERAVLTGAGRGDLARRARWTSDEEGDAAGYDIASFEPDGRTRLIEVKTTRGWDRTPFIITSNELAVAEERRREWCLFRLWDFSRAPRAFELRPPLDAHVSLVAATFRANVG